jgi:hypothetical protein
MSYSNMNIPRERMTLVASIVALTENEKRERKRD